VGGHDTSLVRSKPLWRPLVSGSSKSKGSEVQNRKRNEREREKKEVETLIKVDTLSGSVLVSKDSPSCDESDSILGTRRHIESRIIASLMTMMLFSCGGTVSFTVNETQESTPTIDKGRERKKKKGEPNVPVSGIHH
jgi:hypothetical protein